MKLLSKIDLRPITNASLIDEVESGHNHGYVQRHQTYIQDQNVRAQILKMSVLETIS